MGQSAEKGPPGNLLQINPTKLQKRVCSSSSTLALRGDRMGAPTARPQLPPAQVGLPVSLHLPARLPLLTGLDRQDEPEMLRLLQYPRHRS